MTAYIGEGPPRDVTDLPTQTPTPTKMRFRSSSQRIWSEKSSEAIR